LDLLQAAVVAEVRSADREAGEELTPCELEVGPRRCQAAFDDLDVDVFGTRKAKDGAERDYRSPILG
jgi:hypothetical protein